MNALLRAHLTNEIKGIPATRPLTEEQIADQLGWSISMAHRCMEERFGSKKQYNDFWKDNSSGIARLSSNISRADSTGRFVDYDDIE